MPRQLKISVEAGGNVRCVYDESIDLRRLGTVKIRRGSHVEPSYDGAWTANLSPVGGPILGPFEYRTEALNAELAWLEQHWL